MTDTSALALIIERDPDEDDRIWLERLVNSFAAGMKAAYTAAVEIAKNWTKGRAVGRLYPDYPDAAAFLKDYVGTIRLPRDERDRFIVALVESGASRRSAAKAAGVTEGTARKAVRKNTHPSEPGPADELVKHINGILGPKTTLPDEVNRWLVSGVTAAERAAVSAALDRLIERVAEIKRNIG